MSGDERREVPDLPDVEDGAGDEVPLGRRSRAWPAANPFLPERIDAERAALGAEFGEVGLVMTNLGTSNENVRRIGLRLAPVLDRARHLLLR